MDLLSPDVLASDDPWIVLAGTLAHAKTGNFAPLPSIARFLNDEQNPVVVRACAELLGNVGTTDGLGVLMRGVRQGPDWLREECCGGIRRVGYLWLVPWMLEAWRHVQQPSDRESIAMMIVQVLTNKPGPIWGWNKVSEQEYERLVLERVGELAERFGYNAPMWRGHLFGAVSAAEFMRSAMISGDLSRFAVEVLFMDFRQRFEATTGIDCSSAYKDEVFQPLSACDIVEEFLGGSFGKSFVEGQRYFFGHLVNATEISPTTI